MTSPSSRHVPEGGAASAGLLHRMRAAGEFWASVSSFSYALTNVFNRVAVVAIDPMVAPLFRTIPTLGITWWQVIREDVSVARLRPGSGRFIGARVLGVLMLGGTFQMVVGTVGLFYALRLGGVVLVVPVLATGMLWSALIARVFLKEPLTGKIAGGILLAVAGIGVLAYGRFVEPGTLLGSLWSIPLALLPAVGWSVGANATRYALRRGLDKFLALSVEQTWGVVLLVSLVLALGRGPSFLAASYTSIGLLLVAGLLSAAAVVTGAQALSLTSVASVQTINGLNPVIATVIAVLLLGEPFNLLMGIGTIVTVLAVIYVQMTMPAESKKASWEQIL